MKTNNKRNVYYLVALLFVISFMTPHTASARELYRDYTMNGSNDLNLDNLQVGDIIMLRLFQNSPDNWDHVTMYVGNGRIVEAWGLGVNRIVYRNVERVHSAFEAGIYRVETSKAIKRIAVSWANAKARDPGCTYDGELYTALNNDIVNDAIKYVEGPGNTCAYLCGELVWAAYMAASGGAINIDHNDIPDQDADWGWIWGCDPVHECTVSHEEIIESSVIEEIEKTY